MPATGRLLNALRWDKAVDPVAWQPGPTIFERAAAAGIGAFRVAQGPSGRPGCRSAAMRGADYRPADTLGALVAPDRRGAGRRAARASRMVYTGDLDAHRARLGLHVGRLAVPARARRPAGRAARRARCRPGTALHITADHGMVDVPPERPDRRRSRCPELRHGVALLGGEPRARHVYAAPGAAADVLAAWQEHAR